MKIEKVKINELEIDVISLNTVIVGTGASGFNAADCLYDKGQKDIAIVTEYINAGTSRNTGSDKQTYYKLSLSGNTPDSVEKLANVLWSGECVDGDIALCEASLSAQGFYKLSDLGVPFPRNSFGEYIGYKTDHDPSERATSAGPYTSKMMTECLEKSVLGKEIKIFDRHQVIKILTDEKKETSLGLLCFDIQNKEYRIFNCTNIIYATGGPAGIYENSVYPYGHFGASGLAFEAGVKGKNLTEWQYGLASVKPRWNVSGTYMQVLPKFISTNQDGSDEREFLLDFFTDAGEMHSKIFMKGYQWPFDVRKIDGGSSIIDILVYIESSLKGRKVFLDFRENSKNMEVDFSLLTNEALEYLQKAGACFGTPIERLLHMNKPAVDFYLDKGVDLQNETLEITLSAQHNNGGLAIDKWWQTNLNGFFAVGEVSGSHGVYRPGGSALNAGQVGSRRAAEYISAKATKNPIDTEFFINIVSEQIANTIAMAKVLFADNELSSTWKNATSRMSRIGAAIRNKEEIWKALLEVKNELSKFDIKETNTNTNNNPSQVYRLHDMLISQFVYLSSMNDYINNGGKSRGSALYTSPKGNLPYSSLPEIFRFELDNGSFADKIQEVSFEKSSCEANWRERRLIPQRDNFFETVWRGYRENLNID